jgi:hypothetical protein
MDNNGKDDDQHQVGQLGFSCHKALHLTNCFPFLRKACATEVILSRSSKQGCFRLFSLRLRLADTGFRGLFFNFDSFPA